MHGEGFADADSLLRDPNFAPAHFSRNAGSDIAQRVDRPVTGRIRAASDDDVILQQRVERKGFGQPLLADAIQNRVADIVANGDVRDRDDAGAHHALHTLWRAEPVPHVLDAVTVVLARRIFDGIFIRIQRHIEGAVADGMHAAAEACVVAFLYRVVQLVLLDANDAVIVLVVFIGFVETGISPGDATVDTHFHAADPQPFVAEAGNKT